MSLYVEDFGRGLPDDFWENLYKTHKKPLNGAIVGATYKSYKRRGGWKYVRFNEASTDGRGILWDCTRKVVGGTTADGGKDGAGDLVITLVTGDQSDAVAKDDFAGGIVLFTSGALTGQRYFIKSNSAKGDPGTNKFRITFDPKLTSNLSATDTVTVYANKYMNMTIADDNDEIPGGASLAQTIAVKDYGFVQCQGLGPAKANATMAATVQDGTPLIKGSTGELKLMPDANLKVPIANVVKNNDIANNAIFGVEWIIPFEM